MSRAIDTSLTVIDPSSTDPIDVHTFADRDRYIRIRSNAFADALSAAVRQEARRRSVRVGGNGRGEAVEFFVLDLKRDKAMSRRVSRLLQEAFLDATNGALKTALNADGFLDASATGKLDVVEEVIELRRFIANATARNRSRSRTELLFHHALPSAAE